MPLKTAMAVCHTGVIHMATVDGWDLARLVDGWKQRRFKLQKSVCAVCRLCNYGGELISIASEQAEVSLHVEVATHLCLDSEDVNTGSL